MFSKDANRYLYDGRNNRYAPDRIPPRPSAPNDGASGPVPRPHNHQPPPPYEPFHPRPGGGSQGNYPIRLIRRGPPPRPATIIKLEGSRCVAVTLLIVFTLAALFIPFRSGSSQPKIARKSSLPHGAFWDPITPAPDCRAYGEREYRGALQNIPKNWADMDACMAMPAEIKRVTLAHPHRCGYIEGSPHIHGFWMVDWDQPDCKPWHKDVTDEVSSREHRYGKSFDTAHPISRVACTQDLVPVVLRLGSWTLTISRNKTGAFCARARPLRGIMSHTTVLPAARHA